MGDAYQLRVAFPSFQNSHRKDYLGAHPHRCFHFALSIRVPKHESTGNFQVVETYSWMPEQVSMLLTGFYGKLIRSHGHIQQGYHIAVPDLAVPPQPDFNAPPFNDQPRKPNGPGLNLQKAQNLIEAYLFSTPDDSVLPKLLSACTFYHLALENWSGRSVLAYTSLVSSVEALLELRTYEESELFDEQRLRDFKAIEESVPDGEKIVRRLKGSLYSIRRMFAQFLIERLPDNHFSERECPEFMALTKERLNQAAKAAYDIRSRFVHTGDPTALGFLSFNHQNTEIQLGEPVIADAELKKLISRSPTLAGLERIVATLLRVEILRWLACRSNPETTQ